MKTNIKTLLVMTAFAVLFTANIASAFLDPNLGRWIQRDPIGEQGGLNLYGYVRNNPVNSIDPLGLNDYNAYLALLKARQEAQEAEQRAWFDAHYPDPGRVDTADDEAMMLAAPFLTPEAGTGKLLSTRCEPKPPGWNSDWTKMGSTRSEEGKVWFDAQGGEWRWHGKTDAWHPEPHWDFNPNTSWNSKGFNVDTSGNLLFEFKGYRWN